MRQVLILILAAFLWVGCDSPVQTIPTAEQSQASSQVLFSPSPHPQATLMPSPVPSFTPAMFSQLSETPLPSETHIVSGDALLLPTSGPTPTLSPKTWRMMPVVPAGVSQRMLEVYSLGQSLGNNPRAFSKVGDCQSTLPMFLADFDNGRYNLGFYSDLQPVVDYFAGSFDRQSRAVKDGLTARAVTVTLWNDWKDCQPQENPLECEYRIHQPSFAIISLGTNDANGMSSFEDALRKVIDATLERGIVPILATKADNAEGDNSINATIVRLAYEYEIPVWNFWLAVQDLPQHGLRSPEHLTYGEYVLPADFSQPEYMQYAFNVRNLTALQVLDVVWRGVTGQSPVVNP